MLTSASQSRDVQTIVTKVGVVKSDVRDKTRKVVVPNMAMHPKYGKVMRRRTVLHVHDEDNLSRNGDLVEVAPCRPRSKTKSWTLVRIVRQAERTLFEEPEDRGVTDFRADRSSVPILITPAAPVRARQSKPRTGGSVASTQGKAVEPPPRFVPRALPQDNRDVEKSSLDTIERLTQKYRSWAVGSDNPLATVFKPKSRSGSAEIALMSRRTGQFQLREGVLLVKDKLAPPMCLELFVREKASEVYVEATVVQPPESLFEYVKTLSRYLLAYTDVPRPVIVGPINGELVHWTARFAGEFARVTAKPFDIYCDWIGSQRQLAQQYREGLARGSRDPG